MVWPEETPGKEEDWEGGEKGESELGALLSIIPGTLWPASKVLVCCDLFLLFF